MEATNIATPSPDRRRNRLLARLRHRQLELALAGRYRESARYAQLAQRVQERMHAAVWQTLARLSA